MLNLKKIFLLSLLLVSCGSVSEEPTKLKDSNNGHINLEQSSDEKPEINCSARGQETYKIYKSCVPCLEENNECTKSCKLTQYQCQYLGVSDQSEEKKHSPSLRPEQKWHSHKWQAEAAALDQCEQDGDKKCQIKECFQRLIMKPMIQYCDVQE